MKGNVSLKCLAGNSLFVLNSYSRRSLNYRRPPSRGSPGHHPKQSRPPLPPPPPPPPHQLPRLPRWLHVYIPSSCRPRGPTWPLYAARLLRTLV